MITEINEHTVYSEEFRNGRNDVISDMEKTINSRLKFLENIADQDPAKFTMSKEHRDGQVFVFKHLLNDLQGLKKKEENSNKWANPNQP